MFYSHTFLKIMSRAVLIVVCGVPAFFATIPLMAQKQAVPITSFNGEIIMVPSSQALLSSAQFEEMAGGDAPALLVFDGAVQVISVPQPPVADLAQGVPDGSRIVVKAGAEATLILPDESQVFIREMSIVEVNGFAWDRDTNERGMLLSLYAGSVRVSLSQTYQAEETFFEVKTPNALVALHFSHPDVEVIYAPSPLENMTALLEGGGSLEPAEEGLWKDVLVEREKDVLSRRRSEFVGLVSAQSDETVSLPEKTPSLLSGQKAFSEIGLVESEADALLEARRLQRDQDLAARFSDADIAKPGEAPAPGLFGPDTDSLPIDVDLDAWQADGLITGEDDLGKGTTMVFAYTVNVSFRNRLTRETRIVQPGQRAVSRGLGMTLTVLNGIPMQKDPPQDIAAVFEFERQRQQAAAGEAASGGSGGLSVLREDDDASLWRFPDAGGHNEFLGNRPRLHTIEVTIAEK